MTEENVKAWKMWAHVDKGEFHHPGHRRIAEMYGQEPIVPVLVRENKEGPYWGWIAKGETVPIMVYLHPSAFAMCFPYGPQKAEARKDGRIVRLSMERILEEVQSPEIVEL